MWPIPQPSPEVKQLVHRFFALVDTKSEEVGKTIADEIFTQDGLMVTANAMFQGAADGTDLFLIGNLKVETLGGAQTNLEFVARMKVIEQESRLKISRYQVVSPAPQVTVPLIEA
ncbi:hypothetical protein N7450_005468 [Penicillium hetheringtonii]|uniref:Uncharacterized protein n=1 Tax=Penicillium hetheringtonii TaxID=911720 RepID=A0AAD6GT43_9EURO|nr:hypothetical protein N7450_005468 [Penicillium hetheringtonii]